MTDVVLFALVAVGSLVAGAVLALMWVGWQDNRTAEELDRLRWDNRRLEQLAARQRAALLQARQGRAA